MLDGMSFSVPSAANVAAYEAHPQVGGGTAAFAGAGGGGLHGVAAHGAGCVVPLLEAFGVELVVAYRRNHAGNLGRGVGGMSLLVYLFKSQAVKLINL